MENVPTVELHRHFEAGLSPQTIARLAQKNRVTEVRLRSGRVIEGVDPQDPGSVEAYYTSIATGFGGPDGFTHFLDSFGLPLSVMVNLEDLEQAAYEQMMEQHRAGSIHTELRGSPFSYQERVSANLDEIILAIKRGIDRAYSEYGMSGAFIACFSRQKGIYNGESRDPDPVSDQAGYVVRAVLRIFGAGTLIGLDVAGAPENKFPPKMFANVMAPAVEAGVPITIHAGEQGRPPDFVDAPASFVVDAIENLRARRIGHGTAIISDSAVMARVRDGRIGIESCPVSNELMGFMPVERHPLGEFLRRGLLVSAGTDDPLMFGVASVREMLVKFGIKLGLDEGSAFKLAGNGVETAFVKGPRRAELRQKLTSMQYGK